VVAEEVLRRIQGEFLEMPGLTLTAAQAQRLWGLDRDLCGSLLAALVEAKFLRMTREGFYVRTEGATPVNPTFRLRRDARRRLESVA
jgi:hypothetical protein